MYSSPFSLLYLATKKLNYQKLDQNCELSLLLLVNQCLHSKLKYILQQCKHQLIHTCVTTRFTGLSELSADYEEKTESYLTANPLESLLEQPLALGYYVL